MQVQHPHAVNPLRFAAQTLKKPLHLVVKSEGDGTYSAVAFKTAKEAEKFARAEGNVAWQGVPETQTLNKIYSSAKEYVREVHGEDDPRMDYLA